MEIIYKISDFPDPGDRDLYKGIQEINKNNYSGALKHFEKASSYKNEYASLFEAIIHFSGFGLKKRNLVKAVDLLQKVASNWNNPVAQYLLGEIFAEGDEDIPRNFAYSVHWLKLSGDKGWTDSNLSLGNHYHAGIQIQKDRKKAVDYFEKVAKTKKSVTSNFEPPVHLFGNKDLELKFSNVHPKIIKHLDRKLTSTLISPVKCVRPLINNHFDPLQLEIRHILFWCQFINMKSSSIALSQACLSLMYAPGENNICRDDKKSLYWSKKAANNGSAHGCTIVAGCYESGIGVDQDYKEAVKWHRQSLILDEYSESNYHFGRLYFFGKGVKKDHKVALQYLTLMIDHNADHGESYYYMGKIFELGEDGVRLSYKQAFEYYLKAFDHNLSMGGSSIGLLYHRGIGVKKDMAKAYQWFVKTSLLHCAAGQYMLGIYYLKGYHVKKDRKKALNLFLRSHERGYEDATTMIVKVICL